jgi:hypothetical protein
VRTSAKVILIVSGTAALGLALWKRRRIAGVAESVVNQTSAVVARVVDVVQAAVGSYGKIPGSTVKRFVDNGLPALITKHLPDFELESGGDPQKINSKSGARGLVQIISKYPRGLTAEERLDADKSLQVIAPEWKDFLRKVRAAGVTDPTETYAFTYFGHNAGVAALAAALKHATEGFDRAITYYRNMDWECPVSKCGAEEHERAIDRLIDRRRAVARRVAAHTFAWAAIEDRVKSGQLAALGSLVVDWTA